MNANTVTVLRCMLALSYLGRVQGDSEAPAASQVGANGLRTAERVWMVVYSDGPVMLGQLQNLQQHVTKSCFSTFETQS